MRRRMKNAIDTSRCADIFQVSPRDIHQWITREPVTRIDRIDEMSNQKNEK